MWSYDRLIFQVTKESECFENDSKIFRGQENDRKWHLSITRSKTFAMSIQPSRHGYFEFDSASIYDFQISPKLRW